MNMGAASDRLIWLIEKGFIFYMINVGLPRHIKDCQQAIRKAYEVRRQRRLNQVTNGGGEGGDGDSWRRRVVNWTVYGKDVDDWDAHGLFLFIPFFAAELVCRFALKVLRRIMIQNPRPPPSEEEIGVTDFVELLETAITFISVPRDIGVSLLIMPRLCFLYQEFRRKLKLRRDANDRLLNDNNDGHDAGAGHH